jgi:YARHG domain
MKKIILIAVAVVCFSCKKEAKLISKTNNIEVYKVEPNDPNRNSYGNWVGDFFARIGLKEKTDLRTDKINIVLQKIEENKVFGYSVVSGEMRPFEGISKKSNENLEITAKESDQLKNNGTFTFTVAKDSLFGKWKSAKKVGVLLREYSLKKQSFSYDSKFILNRNQMYVDYYTKKEKTSLNEDTDMPTYRYADSIVTILNASTKILKESGLKNLKKIELEILRNTIYARHGYSFKSKIVSQFFDSQDWYIPVSDDVSANLTSIEKQNIKTLVRFEKYATDSYDTFGR